MQDENDPKNLNPDSPAPSADPPPVALNPDGTTRVATMTVKNNLATWEQGVYVCPECRAVTCVSSAGPMITKEAGADLKRDCEFLMKIKNGIVVQTKCGGCGTWFQSRGDIIARVTTLPTGLSKANGKAVRR